MNGFGCFDKACKGEGRGLENYGNSGKVEEFHIYVRYNSLLCDIITWRRLI